MEETYSFGYWVRRRRKALDLTQEALADQVGCTRSAIKKIEADERRPSQLMAERLADYLHVPDHERPLFIQSALGVRSISHLPVAAQPLQAPARPLTNLIASLTPFIGRTAEVSSLQVMLMQPHRRLVTLLGPPGVGKTRLAIQVAETMLGTFRDGVWFVDLAPVFDPALVLDTLAHVMNVPLVDATPAADQLNARLANHQALLVLDNFEHVLEAAPAIAGLLAACRELRCLATSRSPLKLRGERQFPVAPLSLPNLAGGYESMHQTPADSLRDFPAIALFVECARAVLPDFALDDENASAIAAICRRLDGLPLAIELVAAHASMLSPEALLERLQGSWVLSLEGHRDVPRHQQTLRGAIEWSYERLTPSEQALFRQMAVFLGGCTFGAAERVWRGYVEETSFPPGADAVAEGASPPQWDSFLRSATSLADRSLLRAEPGQQGETRVLMLDLVRSYALERLESHGEAEAARQRHASEFARLVAEAEPDAHGSRQLFWWRIFSAEIHNLRASLDWNLSTNHLEVAAEMCAGLRHFWVAQNYLQEAWSWIERTLQAIEGSERQLRPLLVARLKNAAGSVAFYRNDHLAAETLFEAALNEARLAEDERAMAYALDGLAVVASSQGRWEESHALSEQSLALSHRAGDRWLSGITLINLGEIARLSGRSELAKSFYQESLGLMREVGDSSFTAVVLHNLGQVSLDLGDMRNASELFRESLDLSISIADYRVVAINLEKLAQVALETGAYLQAARLLGTAGRLRRAYGIPVHALDREDTERVIMATQIRIGAGPYVDASSADAEIPLADVLHSMLDEASLP